jgi:hypothetical protein
LAKEKGQNHWLAEGTLNVNGREIPTEAIIKALQETFLSKQAKVLQQRLTDQLLKEASRKIEEDGLEGR